MDAAELADVMLNAMPDEEVTMETLLDAFAIAISDVIASEMESQDEALEAFKHVNGRICEILADADRDGLVNWNQRGAVN